MAFLARLGTGWSILEGRNHGSMVNLTGELIAALCHNWGPEYGAMIASSGKRVTETEASRAKRIDKGGERRE